MGGMVTSCVSEDFGPITGHWLDSRLHNIDATIFD
eukprot:COSAG02_NODE_555_length_20407_cov_11.072878_21_plen_35_part_00